MHKCRDSEVLGMRFFENVKNNTIAPRIYFRDIAFKRMLAARWRVCRDAKAKRTWKRRNAEEYSETRA